MKPTPKIALPRLRLPSPHPSPPMNALPPGRRRRLARVAGRASLWAATAAVIGLGVSWFTPTKASPLIHPHAAARRADLDVSIRAGGRLESTKKTLIECELEMFQFRSAEGAPMNVGSQAMILDIIADGSNVRRDEVLCRIDASDYEEVVRQQELKLQVAIAGEVRAQLEVDAAELTLQEYREGLADQQVRSTEGQIILAEADVKRQADRLEWARGMVQKDYYSAGQLLGEQQSLLKSQIKHENLIGDLKVLRAYTGPLAIRSLQIRIDSAKANMISESLRRLRTEQRMVHYRELLANCTVKAPHDGFVIYANEPDDDPRVQLGARVTPKMDLFYLPDLDAMEVQTVLNESVVGQIREGMPAVVHLESQPLIGLTGHVVGISPLPIAPLIRGVDQVKGYMGRVRLDGHPEGLLPGMTAQVEILADHRADAILVPGEAVAIEGGRSYCYVAGADGIHRRAIQTAGANDRETAVTRGLAVGDEVILNPSHALVPGDVVPEAPVAPIGH